MRRQLSLDFRATFIERRDNLSAHGERFSVGVGRFDLDVFYTLETMAAGDSASFESQHGNVHHLIAVQGDEPTRRSHKLHGLRAVVKLVAPHFGNGELGNSSFNRKIEIEGERLAP